MASIDVTWFLHRQSGIVPRECEFASELEAGRRAEASDTSKLLEKVRQYGLTGLLGFGKRLKG